MRDPLQIASGLADFCAAGNPRVLMVTHAWGGGVEQHVEMLTHLLRNHVRVMILRPVTTSVVEINLPDREPVRIASHDWPKMVTAIRALKFDRLHMHHLHGLPAAILNLDLDLGVPIEFTLHDYVTLCPQYQLADANGRYCGEPDAVGCGRCIATRPHAWRLGIEAWRAQFHVTLQRAKRVFAPSNSVSVRMHRYFPDVDVTVVAHPEAVIAFPAVTKAVLLGALSRTKGLEAAVAVATLAELTRSALRVRLVGHASEPLPDCISATGSYASDDLPDLLAVERPDVVWLPSQVPESYSLTLSIALATDLPIVASDIGAFSERLRKRSNTILLPFDATAQQWHDALLAAAKSGPRVCRHFDVATPIGNAKVISEQRDFVLRYVDGLPKAVAASDSSLLGALSVACDPSSSAPARSLLDLFRIGVKGGHAPSIAEIERALVDLPAGETGIVGRRSVDRLFEDLARLNEEFVQVGNELEDAQAVLVTTNARWQAALDNARREHDATNQQWRAALDDADARARAASDHIAQLERERVIWMSSRSWRVTRPLRATMRGLSKVARLSMIVLSLLRRTPTLLPRAIQRFRRGGWRGLLDRLRRELHTPAVATQRMLLPVEIAQPIAPLALFTSDTPSISILIPAFGQHATTFACLKSIAEHAPTLPYEVLVADDSSPELASEALSVVSGVRFLRQPDNLGFVGNVNAVAKVARGEWLILLNNDTVVRRGALDALVNTFSQYADAGLVGAKLLNSDGSVQDAGGIVWRDGSAWNWGRGQEHDDPRLNFVRDVDYCSGAAFAIRRELFVDMGGFDTRYAPAYYEDTDLAFRIRALGLRVLYQPAAEVFHLEGVSHGRDVGSGIKSYQAINKIKFFERWQATLQGHRENGAQPELEAHRSSRSNILVVEACMVTPDQDSGSVRMLNLLKILKSEGHHVTFVAANLDGDPKYASQLTSFGVEVLYGRFAGSVRKVLRGRGPLLDTIIFCRHYIASQYLAAARGLAPRARIIFDTVDLHFLREEREAALPGNASMTQPAASTRMKELAVIASCDITWVVSDVEKKLLAQLLPAARVDVVSNIYEPVSAGAPLDERSGILFIGGFRHPPNVDAIKWYVSAVLPHVRRLLPGVISTVIGSNMPDEIKALSADGLLIRGFVEDTVPMLTTARVSIAPLRYGAGIKGKVNEAMSYGIPVVATSPAIEGTQLVGGRDVLVADDPAEFAAAIARVYNDELLWQALSSAGRANVLTCFSADLARSAVRAAFTGK